MFINIDKQCLSRKTVFIGRKTVFIGDKQCLSNYWAYGLPYTDGRSITNLYRFVSLCIWWITKGASNCFVLCNVPFNCTMFVFLSRDQLSHGIEQPIRIKPCSHWTNVLPRQWLTFRKGKLTSVRTWIIDVGKPWRKE